MKQGIRSKSEDIDDNKLMKDTLARKLAEMEVLHQTICEEQQRLAEENIKLTQEIATLKEENTKKVAEKDQVNHERTFFFTVNVWRENCSRH
jgi:cell division protein FtsB